MRTLVLGGARSGKSTRAEAIAHAHEAAGGRVAYLATSRVDATDAEWVERIALHRARRPATWQTIETTDIAAELLRDDDALLLVDCLAVWTTRMMDDCGIWDEPPAVEPPSPTVEPVETPEARSVGSAIAAGGRYAFPQTPLDVSTPADDLKVARCRGGRPDDPQTDHPSVVATPRERLQSRIDELVAAVERTSRTVVFVTNEVGLSVVPEHWSGRFFRDQLGILNMRVAAACERVELVVAGIPMVVKQP